MSEGVATAHAIAQRVRRGEASATDIARDALDACATAHARLNCCVDLLPELANALAQRIDAMPRAERETLPLAGVPFAVKDNLCIGPNAGLAADLGLAEGAEGRTTCASRLLATYRSPFSATCVARLVRAGAIPVVKANMDEFGFGSSGEHSCFGATRNPLDTTRVPGGSSSGSAALVASGAVPLALGSDTGGSVRQPASFCGVCGFKPTYGMVSRFGLVAYASSLDTVGTLANCPSDIALAMSAMCGRDEHDATSLAVDSASFQAQSAGVRGLRVGVPALPAPTHAGVGEALSRTRQYLTQRGATVIDLACDLDLDAAVAAYYVIAPAEASSNLARYDGVRYGHRASTRAGEGLREFFVRNRSEGFGLEAQRRILLGTHVLRSGYFDEYYRTAQRARRLVQSQLLTMLAGVDALLMPVAPGHAFALGSKASQPALAMFLEDIYTVPISLAGLPALAMPSLREPLPIGVQLVAKPGDDARLLAWADVLDQRV